MCRRDDVLKHCMPCTGWFRHNNGEQWRWMIDDKVVEFPQVDIIRKCHKSSLLSTAIFGDTHMRALLEYFLYLNKCQFQTWKFYRFESNDFNFKYIATSYILSKERVPS